MLGKKNVLTYEEVRERYENFRSRCNKKDRKLKNLRWIKRKFVRHLVKKQKKKWDALIL